MDSMPRTETKTQKRAPSSGEERQSEAYTPLPHSRTPRRVPSAARLAPVLLILSLTAGGSFLARKAPAPSSPASPDLAPAALPAPAQAAPAAEIVESAALRPVQLDAVLGRDELAALPAPAPPPAARSSQAERPTAAVRLLILQGANPDGGRVQVEIDGAGPGALAVGPDGTVRAPMTTDGHHVHLAWSTGGLPMRWDADLPASKGNHTYVIQDAALIGSVGQYLQNAAGSLGQ